jgi:hypothetical protein
LHGGAAIAGRGEHRLPHALLLVRLGVRRDQAERVGVEGDRRVQVRHRDADVIDAGDQGAERVRSCHESGM